MWIVIGICIYVYVCICTCVYVCAYILRHIRSQELHLTYICELFWIVLEISGQGTKAEYERRGSELGVAAGTAILCAELTSSNGSG